MKEMNKKSQGRRKTWYLKVQKLLHKVKTNAKVKQKAGAWVLDDTLQLPPQSSLVQPSTLNFSIRQMNP